MNYLAEFFAVNVILFGIHAGIYFVRKSPHRIFPHCLFIIATSVYYGAGMLVSYCTLSNNQLDTLLKESYVQSGDVAYATLLLLVFLVLLHVFCLFFNNAASFDRRTVNLNLWRASRPRFFFVSGIVVLLIQLYLLQINAIGYMGINTSGGSYRINPIAATIQPFTFGLLLLSGFRQRVNGEKIWTALMALAQLAFISFQGRRIFVVAIAFYFLGSFLSGAKRKNMIIVAIPSAFLIIITFYFFTALRMASWETGNDITLFGLITHAAQQFVAGSDNDREALAIATKENLEARPFIINYLAMLTASPRENFGAMGRIILIELQMAVPSIFSHAKDAISNQGGAKSIADIYLYVPAHLDEPETLITDFYIDFREIGILLAPFFYILCILILKQCQAVTKIAWFQIAIFSFVLFSSLNIEETLTEWFVDIRLAAVLAVFGGLYAFLFRDQEKVQSKNFRKNCPRVPFQINH